MRTNLPIKSVVDKVNTCDSCYSQLEKLWVVCPYCGHKIKEGDETNLDSMKQSPTLLNNSMEAILVKTKSFFSKLAMGKYLNDSYLQKCA